jgi:trigger factor
VKVEIEEISAVRRKLHVQVPADEVTAEFERAYRKLQRTARVKGFRPGKAPRSLLERLYGDQVRYEVTSQLIQETYRRSLDQNDITPVSQPDIGEVDVQSGADLHYTASVEIKPQVRVADYVGLEVESEPVQVTDAQVESRLEEIREMFARLEDMEEGHPVAEGDFVLALHRVVLAGQAQDAQGPEELMMEVRPQRMEEALFKALVGVGVGQTVTVPHRFPEDHPDPKLAGKDGALEVTVKAIRKRVLPELDDAFAKRLGEYETLDALRVKVREELEEGERRRIRSAQNESVIDQLLKANPIEVPEALVALQIEEMLRDARRRLAVHGITLEQAGGDSQQMRERYRDPAVKAVRTSFILEAIARQEGLEVTQEALEAVYERLARQSGRDIRQIREMYREPDAMASLKGSLLEEKALDFLIERATIKVKKTDPKK